MVNKQVLLIAPIIFLFTISMFSLMGLSNGTLGEGYIYGLLPEPYLYDYTGREIIYTANFTSVNEKVTIRPFTEGYGTGAITYMAFSNTTGLEPWIIKYYLYKTSVGNSTGLNPILMSEYDNAKQETVGNGLLDITADFNSSYGVIALFVTLMVAIGLAGIHFFGIGESETSLQTIFMGIGFLAVWVIFSVISLNLLATIPYGIGAVFYFGLTVSYILGLILNIGKG